MSGGRPKKELLELALAGSFRGDRHAAMLSFDASLADAVCAIEDGEFTIDDGKVLTARYWFHGDDVKALYRWLDALMSAQADYTRAAVPWMKQKASNRFAEICRTKWQGRGGSS